MHPARVYSASSTLNRDIGCDRRQLFAVGMVAPDFDGIRAIALLGKRRMAGRCWRR